MMSLRSFDEQGTSSWKMVRSRSPHAAHAPIRAKNAPEVICLRIFLVTRSTRLLKLFMTKTRMARMRTPHTKTSRNQKLPH